MKKKAKGKGQAIQMSDIFTSEEVHLIMVAACRTWSNIGSDAEAIGIDDLDGAIEMVLDAGRILDTGRLDKDLYKKLMQLPIKYQDAFMRVHAGEWYGG